VNGSEKGERAPLEFDVPAERPAPPAAFHEACESFGIGLDAGEIDRLSLFLAMLLRANERVNLTAIRDTDEAWVRHIFDALTLLSVLGEVEPPADTPMCIADIGSGGGLPAIPLAIAMPDARFTLIEATAKKAAFLEAVAAALELANVEVVCERAEAVGQDHRKHRERYDVVTARAVGKVNLIAELCVPLAKVGGAVVLVKGERAEEELAGAKAALHLLHTAPAGVIATPTGRLVVLHKLRKTPRLYPRRVGEPKRKPLGAPALD
jgi:16S rRNA (guanine527-N7)-methyltransferase